MLEFKKIEIQDIPLFKRFFKAQEYRLCDFTSGVLFMWAETFGYEYAVYQDTLFVKGKDMDNPDKVTYALPIGELPLLVAIEVLSSYNQDDALSLCAVPECLLDKFTGFCNTKIEPMTDWHDYLYSAESLSSLVGHKYNKKRNRVNLFKRKNQNNFEFSIIKSCDMQDIFEFLSSFENVEGMDERLAYYAKNDLNKTREVIQNFEEFGYDCMVLRIDGHVCGITIGEVVNDTLHIHVEKADKKVDGIYQALSWLFASAMKDKYDIKYINRGEDMGDKGLRQAKESYNPLRLLKKYRVELTADISTDN